MIECRAQAGARRRPGVPIASLLLAPWLMAAQATALELRFIGEAGLATGTRYAGTEVGGLSGIDYDAESDSFLAISDDPWRRDPARYYRIRVDLGDGRLEEGDLQIVEAVTLRDAGHDSYAPRTTDPEAIRLHPGTGRVYWASEGNARRGIGPAVIEARRDGTEVRALSLPDYYRPGDGHGIRFNKAFESLALSADGAELVVALENALLQDGPAADLSRGSPVRVLRIDRAAGRPVAEAVYLTEPVPRPGILPVPAPDNGLVELLAIDDARLLAVERGFAIGAGVTVRLFETGFDGASDVLGRVSLADGVDDLRFMPKRLLLDLSALDLELDNIEGATFGPVLPNGRRSLVLVSDNNFRDSQFTQFLAFEIAPAGEARPRRRTVTSNPR